MARTIPKPPVNYYNVLNIRRDASPTMVEAAFRRSVARYRPTVPVLQLLTDRRFLRILNAYLTVIGPERKEYAYAVATWKDGVALPTPEPYADLPQQERELLTARMAYWRREMADVLHVLRQITGRNPGCAPAWALMGEFYLTVGRLEEGIGALEKAVAADPSHEGHATRLEHARTALDGDVELEVEPSPEEEMLREERKVRWRLTLPLLIAGALVVVTPLMVRPVESELGFLAIPWLRVAITAVGILLTFFALGYGRIIQPFERVMVWSSISASDRGTPRSYPYALIIFVTALASMWLTLITLGIIAALDEEWPGAPSFLITVCIGATVGLAGLLAGFNLPWGNVAMFGGNVMVVAGMLGWWIGSLGTPTYD